MIKHVSSTLAVLALPVVAIGGCSNQASDNASTSTTSSGAAGAQTLTTQVNTTDGKHVADATVDFSNGYATVTVETVAGGALSPGFHSMHIHQTGTCDANTGFASAGEHFQAPGHTGQPASGDLPPLLVRADGQGKLVATSDAFTADQLKGPQGSSIVLHAGGDMGGMPSAEADQRIACGVLSPASAASTSVSTSTSTSTVTTTAVAPPGTATVTETPSATSPSSASSSTTTSTSTVSTTQPTLTTTSPPPPGG